jgi:hypothetical protein
MTPELPMNLDDDDDVTRVMGVLGVLGVARTSDTTVFWDLIFNSFRCEGFHLLLKAH